MQEVYSTVTLVAPFNIDKLYELIRTHLTQGGFSFPPIEQPVIETNDASLRVLVPEGQYTQLQLDAIINALNLAAADPTRNDLTEDQVELAEINARIDFMTAGVGAINNTGGLNDQLLTNSAWNALSADAQADILRNLYRANQPALDYRDILVEVLKSVKWLLKQEKKRQVDGVDLN